MNYTSVISDRTSVASVFKKIVTTEDTEKHTECTKK